VRQTGISVWVIQNLKQVSVMDLRRLLPNANGLHGR
jgi:hypothetical protein